VILRFTRLDPAAIANGPSMIRVCGTEGGIYRGETRLASDGVTFIFQPASPFLPGDTLTVSLSPQQLLKNLPIFSYQCTVSRTPVPELSQVGNTSVRASQALISIQDAGARLYDNGVVVPSDFPLFKPDVFVAPADGALFFAVNDWLMILDNVGNPLFWKRAAGKVWDFTRQREDRISYMSEQQAVTLDPEYQVVHTYACGHGYLTDPHEFVLLPNGNGLLIAEDTQIMDLSGRVPGGQEAAEVVGNHVQEITPAGEVVFEWRCWDHFDVLDARHENLTNTTIRSVHMNAIDVDFDGHYLISSRHLDEITKINRETGAIIWRWGGNHNQFTFLNGALPFNYQHDIRAVASKPGYYTLMDNGNHRVPAYSRAVEYRLDTLAMTAEEVWSYRHDPDRFSSSMASTQRLENGSTLIGWARPSLPKVSEVSETGALLFEGDFTDPSVCYRAHRYSWAGRAQAPKLHLYPMSDGVFMLFNHFGAESIAYYRIYGDTLPEPVTLLDTAQVAMKKIRVPSVWEHGYFRVTSVSHSGVESPLSNEAACRIKIVKPGDNLLDNGDFANGLVAWHWAVKAPVAGQVQVDAEGRAVVEVISSNGTEGLSLQQSELPMEPHRQYQLTFDAEVAQPTVISVKAVNAVSPTVPYGGPGHIILNAGLNHYQYNFTVSSASYGEAALLFQFGSQEGQVILDNVVLEIVDAQSRVYDAPPLPQAFVLMANYPNPFNSETEIAFSLAVPADVSLRIFNSLGQQVACLAEGAYGAGVHKFPFQGRDLPSGVYVIRLNISLEGGVGGLSRTGKMLLLR